MKNKFKLTDLILTLLLVVFVSGFALSSSHREAPLISNDPLADNVDLYAFRSPDNPDMISIIATYVPFQLPHGGPNYYNFGENIRYEIHVDNDAAVAGDEITYRFTFTIVNEDPTTFFNIRLGLQNQKATYNLERSIDGGQTFQMIIENGIVPPNNIGPRSIGSPVGLDADYETLWRNSIMTASTGEQVFAGPSDDPFFVDLGGIFDLGDAPRQNGDPVDGVACFNVSTIAIQVPITTLLKAGAPLQPTNILDPDYVIGVWASASRPAITTLSSTGDPTYEGDWIQVSRLGMPLTNEAVIPIGDKDYWNSITPYDEIGETTLDEYFYNPELALYMDDDQFGAAVPAFAPLRIQTNSLGAFDFSNGADGLFSLKGSDAVEGTALDDAIFGTLLLPAAGKPRSVDLWPAFHTGVPNVIPYQLATGKEGNPLAAGKPFVNNFLPNGGDMLRLNMAVPTTDRTDPNFSSIGLIQAAAIGLTVAPFNTTADLEFIPNMDGFPNGRRLEDDVTRIELQAVSGAVLAAIGLWYDDYDPATSPSPVTDDLLNVLSYTTGVEANDKAFGTSFPYVALPFSGTGDCSGSIMMVEECTAQGGMLSLGDGNTEATICSDGIPDVFDLTLTGNSGTSIYVVTDNEGNILGNEITLPLDFDLFETGTIQVYNLSYTGNIDIPAIGGNLDQLTGCFDLSNALTVTVQMGDECAPVEVNTYTASLTGTQEVNPALTMASGTVTATLTGMELVVSGDFKNLSADFDANVAGGSHIHMAPAGRAGGIVRTLVASLDEDLRGGTFAASDNTFILTDEEVSAFLNRHFYINIHTTAWAAGELRGQLLPATEAIFQTNLVGSNQSPQVVTSATGGVIFELTGNTITVSGSFDGLSSDIATQIAGGAHIHHAPAGRAGDVVRVLDLTIDEDNQGAIIEASKNTFELTDEELGWLNFNALYINVHSSNHQGGEIRGQMTPLSLASFRANLVGIQQFPPLNTEANGLVLVNYHDGGQVSVSGSFNSLGSDLAVDIAGGIHLHLNSAGLAGPVITPLTPDVDMTNRSAIIFPADNSYTLDDTQVSSLFNRGIYVNVHSLDNAGGELRGQVLPIAQAYFATNLAGINEVQPVSSNASGNVQFEWSAGTLTVSGGFSNLMGDFNANVAGGSHIHMGDAGANGGISFTLAPTLDTDNKGGIFEAANNAFMLDETQMEALANGANYVNIHTTMFAGGELRGQILTDANQFPGVATISSPEDGATVSIDGAATSDFSVSWTGSTDANGDDVVYIWQLFSDAEASNLLMQVSTAGATTFNTTQDVISDLLTQLGVDEGASITLYHRALASDGSISTPGPLASVNVSRVASVVLEGCHVPQNVTITQLGNNRVKITWDRVNAARSYELRIGFQASPGSFTDIPIRRNRVFVTGPSDRVIDIQVRAVCSRGERSDYTEVVSYSTGKGGDKSSTGSSNEIRVSEIEFEGSFTIFPNPAQQQVTIAYRTERPGTTMTIYSMTGQQISTQQLTEGREFHNLDVTSFSDGVYLINVAVNGQVIHSKKLFKTQR